MEHFVNRQNPFLFPKLSEYTKLQDKGKGKSIRACANIASFCKSNSMVRVYGIVLFQIYRFSSRWVLRILLPVLSMENVRVFCVTRSFQHFNNMHVRKNRFHSKLGVPSHIVKWVMQLLKRHFGNGRIISLLFATAWFLKSPDIDPCAIQLWGYLRYVVFSIRQQV